MTNPHPTVALLASLDTKGDDASFLRDRIAASGIRVLTVDVGVLGDPSIAPDYPAAEVAALGGATLEELRAKQDRSTAIAVMSAGAERLVADLFSRGVIDGILAIGGGGGTTIGSTALRSLPLGLPKIILSTVAAGDTSNYVGTSDIVMFPSLVDVAGVNSISRLTYAAAADALVGMVAGRSNRAVAGRDRPIIAASMFGVTTPAVLRAQMLLDAHDYEVIVFHATGAGGRTMERLCDEGYFTAVLDLTTTEWADEIVGGILSAGHDRLGAAARTGLPQVVSVGATDMVNFGRLESLPAEFTDRLLYEHNAENTLMRTTAKEATRIGSAIGAMVRHSTGPTRVLLPEGGVSALDAPGQVFADPVARTALADALERELAGSPIAVVRTPLHINDPEFADLAVRELLTAIAEKAHS